MSYIQVFEHIYLDKLRAAAPHTPQEPCTCDGSCKNNICDGEVLGCDCDINYIALEVLQNTEPVLPVYNVRKI